MPELDQEFEEEPGFPLDSERGPESGPGLPSPGGFGAAIDGPGGDFQGIQRCVGENGGLEDVCILQISNEDYSQM